MIANYTLYGRIANTSLEPITTRKSEMPAQNDFSLFKTKKSSPVKLFISNLHLESFCAFCRAVSHK